MKTFELFGEQTTIRDAWIIGNMIEHKMYWELVVAGNTVLKHNWEPAFGSTDITELLTTRFNPCSKEFECKLTSAEDFFVTMGGEALDLKKVSVILRRGKNPSEGETIVINAIGELLNTESGRSGEFTLSCPIEFRGVWFFGATYDVDIDTAILTDWFPNQMFHLSVTGETKRFYNVTGAAEHFRNS